VPFGELNNEIRIHGVRDDLRNGGELAACFGWDSEALSSRTITRGGSSIKIARAEVAGQPAALFALNNGQSAQKATDMAALYAYHAAVDWGVVADDTGLTIFNSHWLLEKAWFTLPRIQWDDAVDDSELLRSLSPAGVVEGEISRLAIKQKRPTEFLKPVDDELVERLDKWRDEALRFARDAGGVDSRLQTLYAQLFVLRTVEDSWSETCGKASPIRHAGVFGPSPRAAFWFAALAQLVEHVIRNDGVTGSSPVCGTSDLSLFHV
jgi:hypothetical protein